jgi:ribonuclease HI
MAVSPKHVTLYTDGACSGNPGPGGWGAILRCGDVVKELSGFAPATTNNQMEMQAVIEGLAALKDPCDVTLFTDSQYVLKGATEWMAGWKKRGWITADKKPVKNQDYWQKIDMLCQRHRVQWRWVRGHTGDAGNERADTLAREAILTKGSRP